MDVSQEHEVEKIEVMSDSYLHGKGQILFFLFLMVAYSRGNHFAS